LAFLMVWLTPPNAQGPWLNMPLWPHLELKLGGRPPPREPRGNDAGRTPVCLAGNRELWGETAAG